MLVAKFLELINVAIHEQIAASRSEDLGTMNVVIDNGKDINITAVLNFDTGQGNVVSTPQQPDDPQYQRGPYQPTITEGVNNEEDIDGSHSQS